MEVDADGRTGDERAEELAAEWDRVEERAQERQQPRRQTLALERIGEELHRIAELLEPLAKRETERIERERYYERMKARSHEPRVRRAQERGKDVLEVGCPVCHVYMTVPCDLELTDGRQ